MKDKLIQLPKREETVTKFSMYGHEYEMVCPIAWKEHMDFLRDLEFLIGNK